MDASTGMKNEGEKSPLNKTQTGSMDQGRGQGFTQVQIRTASKNQQTAGKCFTYMDETIILWSHPTDTVFMKYR